MKLITDIIFNPLTENKGFNEKYVEQEKENLLKKIESKKDDKATYAYNRCVEEMFKGDSYSLYKYGYKEDLEKINAKNLYKYYKEMIETARIDIFICGPDAESVELRQRCEELATQFHTHQGEFSFSPQSTALRGPRSKRELVKSKNYKRKPRCNTRKINHRLKRTKQKQVCHIDVQCSFRRRSKLKTIPKCKRKRRFSILCRLKLCKKKRRHIHKNRNRTSKL